MTKLRINGTEYPLADGFLINKKYNEELNSATITIPFSDKLNLSPFDFVEIEDDRFGIEYFVVDTWVETTVSFNPLKYNYDINLVSETIKLQKIVMPNLTITHPLGKEPKLIKQKLQEYYLGYIYPQYNELDLDDSIFTLLDECPEEEFNRPTAFEVFNTILGKLNAVVSVQNHKIGFIKLDQYGDEINESKLYHNNDTQTIKDYANRLDIQVANGVAEKKNFSSIAGITVRGGENQAVVNDDNMLLLLEKPIYDIGDETNVYVYVPYLDEETGKQDIAKLNITDNVVEKAVYDTYKISSSTQNVVGKYKRNALYYQRGGKTIEGLGYSESGILGFSTPTAINNIIENKLKTQIGEDVIPDFTAAETRKKIYFAVEYKSNESFRFVVEKTNDYNATLVDNQSESQVDILNFGKVEQDKLNRLGNKNQIITATYMLDDEIPKLGDYIGRYVLAQTEIAYYKDYALFKGYLYKDYVRKNMFYGLNSKKRSTQISTENVIRNDVINIDVKFQLERYSYDNLIRYILMPLSLSGVQNHSVLAGYDYYEYPKYCLFRASDENYQDIYDYWVLTQPSSFVCGKSNVINFQMLDNYNAGIRVNGTIKGGDKQEYVQYTDDYGNFMGFVAHIYTNKRNDLIDNATITDFDSYRKFSDDLPMATDENLKKFFSANRLLSIGKTRLYKDNRETTAISVNINYRDSENVIVGDFAKYTGIGYRYNIAYTNIGIMYSTTDDYEPGDEYGVGIMDDSVYLDFTDASHWLTSDGVTNTLDNLSLYLGGKDTSQWKSWAIVEKDTGRLILGINKGNQSTIPTTIYLKAEEKTY